MKVNILTRRYFCFIFAKLIGIIVIQLMITGCATSVKVTLIDEFIKSTPPPKTLGSIKIFMPNEPIIEKHEVVANISVYDSGLSINCNHEQVIGKIRRKVFEMGANAAQVYEVIPPSFWSTCYQMKARILVLTQ